MTEQNENIPTAPLGFIQKNKGKIILFSGLLLAAVGTSLVYWTLQKKGEATLANAIYAFRQETLIPFEEKKIDLNAFTQGVEAFRKKEKNQPGLLLLYMDIAEKYHELKEYAKELSFIEETKGAFYHSAYGKDFYLRKKVALLEREKNWSDATEVLEQHIQGLEFNQAMFYYWLGHLYFKKGDNKKAELNWKFVVERFGEQEEQKQFVELARWLLKQKLGVEISEKEAT